MATQSTTSDNPQEVKQPQSFTQLVDYNKISQGLKEDGVDLTEDEKIKLAKICNYELRKHDGFQLSNDLGGFTQDIFTKIFSFIKQFVLSFISGDHPDAGEGSVIENATDQSRLLGLNRAAQNIFLRLKQEGGNLAKAAEFVSGQTSDISAPNDSYNINRPYSVYSQIRGTKEEVKNFDNIPWGTDLSLKLNLDNNKKMSNKEISNTELGNLPMPAPQNTPSPTKELTPQEKSGNLIS